MKRTAARAKKAPSTNPKPPKRPRRDENTPARPPTADKAAETAQQRRGGATNTSGRTTSTAGSASATATPTQNGSAAANQQQAPGQSAGSSQVEGEEEEEVQEPSEDEREPEDTTTDLYLASSDGKAFLIWLASLSSADSVAIRTIGRQACMYVPFDKFEQVFHYGALAEAKEKDAQPDTGDKAAEFTFTLAERCAWEWKHLKESFPVIQDLLARHNSKFLARQLNHHRGARRSEDTARLKKLVPGIRTWVPRIEAQDANKKAIRGLQHPQMAQLLLPRSEDWSRRATQHAYLLPPKKKLSPLVMPRLLYPEDDPHQKNGFCKNELLPRMAQGLVLGAEAAAKGDQVAAGNSITNKHNINFVTLPFMGYVGCQGRCAIADEKHFGAAGEHGFKYKVFFNQILKTLVGIEALGPTGEDIITDLMTWWQERIWGEDAGIDEQDDAEPMEELTDTPQDVLAEYRQYTKEVERELAAARADEARSNEGNTE